MTDPRVLVRLDLLLGLLVVIAVLLSVQLVAEAPDVGVPAVLLVAAASGIGAHRYRRELEAAAG